jgi:hypothetical protein
MKKRLRRIRAAVGMGVTWAAGWALIGVLIEIITQFVPGWDGALVDIWPAALALVGFLGGAVFSTVLRIAEGRRRFDELSLLRFGAWGAVGGLLLGVLFVLPGLVGAGFDPGQWLEVAALIGSATLLSPVSAAGSLALARMAEERELLDASADVDEVGLTGGEAQELLGGRG